MQALVVLPEHPHSTRVAEVPTPDAGEGAVLIRTLEIGVCGTDREISEGLFGVAPDGSDRLALRREVLGPVGGVGPRLPRLVPGHALLGKVEQDGHGLSRGELVTATVRRSCGLCAACLADAPDSCQTG